jgi:hypothetical protein
MFVLLDKTNCKGQRTERRLRDEEEEEEEEEEEGMKESGTYLSFLVYLFHLQMWCSLILIDE